MTQLISSARDDLEQRAARGARRKLETALAQRPDTQSDAGDHK
jgi:hypothetical protein